MKTGISRREAFELAGAIAGGGLLASLVGCERDEGPAPLAGPAPGGAARPGPASSREEYVWVSANANLPLFVAHDHLALRQVGEELGVRVTIAGPDSIDIPSLISAIEQTAARRPTGMMVVGWDPSALVSSINKAVEAGIPVVCVDADVPASKRFAFVGTDWHDLGVRQAEAMVRALQGRRGKVALLGLIEQEIDQRAFAGFRSVGEKAGLAVLEPQTDKGSQAEAARVASALLQAHPDLLGMAGFDSESGPGIGQAIREARKSGQVVATSVDAEKQHLRLVKEGVLTACVGQKRELFTYQGVKALHDIVHARIRFTKDDKKAGMVPVPEIYYTGSYTVTRENVDYFLQ